MKKSSQFLNHKKKIFNLKNHPFLVPVITLLCLVVVTLVAFVSFGSTVVRPADARVVHVFADNQEFTLTTRAQNVSDLLNRLDIKINKGDIVEPALDAPILEDDFSINIYRSRTVVIQDGKRRVTTETATQSARIIARNNGIVVYPEDELLPEAPDDILDAGVIGEYYSVKRAKPVTLILYGKVLAIRTQASTIGELLGEKAITLSEGDNISPGVGVNIENNLSITITRPGQRIDTEEQEIKPPIEYVNDNELLQGETKEKEPGSPGRKIITYDVKVEDGVVVEKRKIQEIVAVKPTPRVVARGTKIVITNPSENVEIGRRLAAEKGWEGNQFYCLYQLWEKESHWNTTSGNQVTGAYGIPQALPGSKMSTFGDDWRFNPETQIKWGLSYIGGRYGSPCGAWNFFLTNNWY